MTIPARHLLTGRQLTDRQLEILTRVSHGLTNAQIGRDLYISEDAVKSAMRRILGALDAHDRAHAVRRGFERGVLRSEVAA